MDLGWNYAFNRVEVGVWVRGECMISPATPILFRVGRLKLYVGGWGGGWGGGEGILPSTTILFNKVGVESETLGGGGEWNHAFQNAKFHPPTP